MRLRGIPGIAAYAPALESRGLARDYARDRIAAVMDREAMALAIDRRHKIAVFAIDGSLAADRGTRDAIETLAEATFGVDKGSARMSMENATLSLAFDPGRVAFEAILRILDRKLATMRLSLLPMALLD
jgi:hypothetical protein